jgi:hypothetical protein
MSWKPEVIADSSKQWAGNSLRFFTEQEAEFNVKNLEGRWMSVTDTRVVESPDPVNYMWVGGIDGKLVRLDPTCVLCENLPAEGPHEH